MGAKSIRDRTALYLRLSKDDEGMGESASITNQRSLLTAYAKENSLCVVLEFVDDGVSGTTFERPAFQEMLAAIEGKKLDVVLVKDLSRLGREYIQTGQLTELYFPSKGVRCIAVNDGYDSDSPHSDIAPFKNIVNEMYARDTSKKIRSAFSIKMREGAYIGNFAPYGYRKDPGDKNHLIPDETSAAVVKDIFSRAARGERPAEIARALNDQGLLSPALYRCVQHPQLNEDAYTKRREWTAAAVTKLLRNVVYLGHMAQGKTTKVSFKSKTTLRNVREDWIIVEHTHEAIVSEALFDGAQKRLQSRVCEKKGQFTNLFSGLAKCADCGRNLSTVGTRKKDSPANLACGGYKLYGSSECSNHFIDYNALYGLVLDAVREQTALSGTERETLYRELQAQPGAASDEAAHKKEERRLKSERERAERLIEALYEDRADGVISEERFRKLIEKYEVQAGALQTKLDALEQSPDTPQETAQLKEAFDRLKRAVERYTEIQELTADLLFDLIDRIEVGQGRYEQTDHGKVKHQQVTIWFRFLTQEQSG